jgi:hypothetical protein
MLVKIGTKTNYGIIKAVGYVGERYYWIIDEHKTVSMIPAKVIEKEIENERSLPSLS